MTDWLRRLHEDEAGHNSPAGTMVVGILTAIGLTWGIVADIDGLTIAGGVGLAITAVLAGPGIHREVDYSIFRRLDALEQSDDE